MSTTTIIIPSLGFYFSMIEYEFLESIKKLPERFTPLLKTSKNTKTLTRESRTLERPRETSRTLGLLHEFSELPPELDWMATLMKIENISKNESINRKINTTRHKKIAETIKGEKGYHGKQNYWKDDGKQLDRIEYWERGICLYIQYY